MKYNILFTGYQEREKTATTLRLLFPFRVVDSSFIGTAEELSATKTFSVDAKITHHKLLEWRLPNEDVPKVLFEYSKRKVDKAIKDGEEPGDFKLEITSGSHKGPCPFNVSRLKLPDGVALNVEVERTIGFKPMSRPVPPSTPEPTRTGAPLGSSADVPSPVVSSGVWLGRLRLNLDSLSVSELPPI